MAEWQYVWLIRLKSPWVVIENQSMEHCIGDAMRPLPMWSISLPKEFVFVLVPHGAKLPYAKTAQGGPNTSEMVPTSNLSQTFCG